MSEKRMGRPPIGAGITVKLPDDHRAFIREKAARAGCPEAVVIRELLAAGIAAKQKEQP